MKRKFMAVITALSTALFLSVGATQATEITGAGATFPAPVYAKWAAKYKEETGISVNYQAIGSGGGIKQIKKKTVDFGATDAPMSGEDLNEAGLVQFPAVIGGVVAVVNLPGIGPGEIYVRSDGLADLFMGRKKRWNELNPSFPDLPIVLVYRSDSSGTTAVFTDYLAGVSSEFKEVVGVGKTVNWPSGVGGKGNAGVAATVQKIQGSIGYVEYAFAKNNNLSHVAMVNRAGNIVQPGADTFAAAAAGADWNSTPGMGISLNNVLEENAWPITAATFILMYRNPENKERSERVKEFFRWAWENGDEMALELDYVPLPDSVVNIVENNVLK